MTIYVGDRAAASFPVAKGHTAGAVHVAYGSYEVDTLSVIGDTYELCKVPAGAVILGGMFYCDYLDTNASETMNMDVGWKANGGSGTYDAMDADGLADLGVMNGDVTAPNLAQAVGLVYNMAGPHFANGDFPTFTRETTIQVTCVAVQATLTAGAMSVYVLYTTP